MKPDDSRALLHEGEELGHEARAVSTDHATLKLWLRMLACTTQIEAEIRRRLRARFGISLARFDYLAQLRVRVEGQRIPALGAIERDRCHGPARLPPEVRGLVARELLAVPGGERGIDAFS